MTTDIRYPIGRFARPAQVTDKALSDAVDVLAALPAKMRSAVAGVTFPRAPQACECLSIISS